MAERMTNDQKKSLRDLVAELRTACRSGKGNYGHRLLCGHAAECIEQLQMSPAKVRELAQTEDGADTLALVRALGMQVEGQRKHIATLESKLRRACSDMEANDPLNARAIFGEPQ